LNTLNKKNPCLRNALIASVCSQTMYVPSDLPVYVNKNMFMFCVHILKDMWGTIACLWCNKSSLPLMFKHMEKVYYTFKAGQIIMTTMHSIGFAGETTDWYTLIEQSNNKIL